MHGKQRFHLFVLATILMTPLAAQAEVDLVADTATVDDAKATGFLGEQADGMLGAVRGDPDAAIMGAAAEINMLRREGYRKAAAGAGTTEQAEAAKAGQHNIDALPAGQFYKPSGGGWTKK
jgi:uncharacterized protein YdbL (DUF1318 family)